MSCACPHIPTTRAEPCGHELECLQCYLQAKSCPKCGRRVESIKVIEQQAEFSFRFAATRFTLPIVTDAMLADWLGLDPHKMTWIVNGRKMQSIGQVVAAEAGNSLPMLMATSASRHEAMIANENAMWYHNLLNSTRKYLIGWFQVILVFFTSIFITPTSREEEQEHEE